MTCIASYRAIASAVLTRAAQDLDGDAWRPALRFLAYPSDDLAFWCELAGISMTAVRESVRAKHRHQLHVLWLEDQVGRRTPASRRAFAFADRALAH
jgi:hypothetical protein